VESWYCPPSIVAHPVPRIHELAASTCPWAAAGSQRVASSMSQRPAGSPPEGVGVTPASPPSMATRPFTIGSVAEGWVSTQAASLMIGASTVEASGPPASTPPSEEEDPPHPASRARSATLVSGFMTLVD
jgi:hypothetical protein